jgi:hypothetical protein
MPWTPPILTPDPGPALRAAQYVRMSTDFQRYSLENQAAGIAAFAASRTGEEVTRVTLFEAAMGPQIGGAIVAAQHGLNPPLVSLMVGVGISLSFLTLPLWSYALHHL